MVSNENQKPKTSPKQNPRTNSNNKDAKDFEKQINDVLSNCKDIIICNNTYMKNRQDGNTKSEKVSTSKKNASEITLEMVAQDMNNILKDLKEHLPAFKGKNDSFSDVVPKVEETFQKSNQNDEEKRRFFVKCNPKPAAKPRNTQPKTAPNVNNKTNNSANNKRPVTKNTANEGKRQSAYKPNTVLKSVYNPLGILKAEVQNAIRTKRTFTIKGNFPVIRRALLNRGWIEKLHISYSDRINTELKKFQRFSIPELVDLLRIKDVAENCKALIKSKLLSDHQVDLYWSYNEDAFKECPDTVKLTKINRFRRELFSYTSKVGLCTANKNSVWYKIPGVADLNHPRSYSLSKNGDTPDFIKDFNRTAAMSLLKWVVRNDATGECKILSPSGKIPIEVFDFAINECYKFIKVSQHEDIDNDIKDAFDFEWNEFLEYFYKTVHIGNHFKMRSGLSQIDMVRKANYILNKLNEFWPFLDMDGIMNIWILKPTNGSQGVGIHICRTLQYILKTIKNNPNKRYIIQKYIERPFLIHNTKFDIRQWFLISSAEPLMIWMYKSCYLRFSSQTYNLRKLHESIHLTNNSVQCRYQKDNRDIALPSYNMWDSTQFKNYLSDIGYANAFDSIIYPGMKQCIIAAILMHQDKLDRRKNCFELYGADFMLTEDFKPWLLEINSNPALHASTPITAKMCPTVLEDVIKVVVDYEANKSANTGGFELVYEKNLPLYGAKYDLQVQGMPLKTDYFYTPLNEPNPLEIVHATPKTSLLKPPKPDAVDYVKQIGRGMRKTLEDLLEVLKNEKAKRQERKNKGVITILSHIITESKESQTEYSERSKFTSETLIKSQLLEIDESKELSLNQVNNMKIVNRTNITVKKSEHCITGPRKMKSIKRESSEQTDTKINILPVKNKNEHKPKLHEESSSYINSCILNPKSSSTAQHSHNKSEEHNLTNDPGPLLQPKTNNVKNSNKKMPKPKLDNSLENPRPTNTLINDELNQQLKSKPMNPINKNNEMNLGTQPPINDIKADELTGSNQPKMKSISNETSQQPQTKTTNLTNNTLKKLKQKLDNKLNNVDPSLPKAQSQASYKGDKTDLIDSNQFKKKSITNKPSQQSQTETTVIKNNSPKKINLDDTVKNVPLNNPHAGNVEENEINSIDSALPIMKTITNEPRQQSQSKTTNLTNNALKKLKLKLDIQLNNVDQNLLNGRPQASNKDEMNLTDSTQSKKKSITSAPSQQSETKAPVVKNTSPKKLKPDVDDKFKTVFDSGLLNSPDAGKVEENENNLIDSTLSMGIMKSVMNEPRQKSKQKNYVLTNNTLDNVKPKLMKNCNVLDPYLLNTQLQASEVQKNENYSTSILPKKKPFPNEPSGQSRTENAVVKNGSPRKLRPNQDDKIKSVLDSNLSNHPYTDNVTENENNLIVSIPSIKKSVTNEPRQKSEETNIVLENNTLKIDRRKLSKNSNNLRSNILNSHSEANEIQKNENYLPSLLPKKKSITNTPNQHSEGDSNVKEDKNDLPGSTQSKNRSFPNILSKQQSELKHVTLINSNTKNKVHKNDSRSSTQSKKKPVTNESNRPSERKMTECKPKLDEKKNNGPNSSFLNPHPQTSTVQVDKNNTASSTQPPNTSSDPRQQSKPKTVPQTVTNSTKKLKSKLDNKNSSGSIQCSIPVTDESNKQSKQKTGSLTNNNQEKNEPKPDIKNSSSIKAEENSLRSSTQQKCELNTNEPSQQSVMKTNILTKLKSTLDENSSSVPLNSNLLRSDPQTSNVQVHGYNLYDSTMYKKDSVANGFIKRSTSKIIILTDKSEEHLLKLNDTSSSFVNSFVFNSNSFNTSLVSNAEFSNFSSFLTTNDSLASCYVKSDLETHLIREQQSTNDYEKVSMNQQPANKFTLLVPVPYDFEEDLRNISGTTAEKHATVKVKASVPRKHFLNFILRAVRKNNKHQ